MSTYWKRILLSVCLAGLTSCSSIPTKQTSLEPTQPTAGLSRTEQLSRIKNWDLKGLIAIRNTKEAWSANWQWHQNQNNYTIGLFGPLGSHSIQLTGSPNSVLLETSEGKKVTASSPETLLEQQLGWRLPVSSLYYWIRGLPVPNIPAQKQLDDSQRITVLAQQGWRIEYLRYSSINQIDLPSKMILNNSALNVKIIINLWQI